VLARGVEHRECFLDILLILDIRKQDGVGADGRDRLHVFMAPGRVEVVHAYHDFAPTVAPGEDGFGDEAARLLLALDQDGVAQVEDHRVDLQGAGFMEIWVLQPGT
jgi:hypothetical protein